MKKKKKCNIKKTARIYRRPFWKIWKWCGVDSVEKTKYIQSKRDKNENISFGEK